MFHVRAVEDVDEDVLGRGMEAGVVEEGVVIGATCVGAGGVGVVEEACRRWCSGTCCCRCDDCGGVDCNRGVEVPIANW